MDSDGERPGSRDMYARRGGRARGRLRHDAGVLSARRRSSGRGRLRRAAELRGGLRARAALSRAGLRAASRWAGSPAATGARRARASAKSCGAGAAGCASARARCCGSMRGRPELSPCCSAASRSTSARSRCGRSASSRASRRSLGASARPLVLWSLLPLGVLAADDAPEAQRAARAPFAAELDRARAGPRRRLVPPASGHARAARHRRCRVLIHGFTDNDIHPPRFGSTQRTFGLYRGLARRHQVRVLCVVEYRNRAARAARPDGVELVRRRAWYTAAAWRLERLGLAPLWLATAGHARAGERRFRGRHSRASPTSGRSTSASPASRRFRAARCACTSRRTWSPTSTARPRRACSRARGGPRA